MIYIAHRGLIGGPSTELENNPQQISLAIQQGYDCEIDLWVIHNKLMLGHDAPTYKIDEDWLRYQKLWIHAKNTEALCWLQGKKFNYFWHENDKFTLTSNEFIWLHQSCNEISTNSVMVMPEYLDPTLQSTLSVSCYAICSDYVTKIKAMRENI